MSSDCDILSALRGTSKGKLKYDPSWHNEGRLKEILEECTSPPKISPYRWHYSPKDYLPDGDSEGLSNTLGGSGDSSYIVLDEISQNDSDSRHTPSYPPTQSDLDASHNATNQESALQTFSDLDLTDGVPNQKQPPRNGLPLNDKQKAVTGSPQKKEDVGLHPTALQKQVIIAKMSQQQEDHEIRQTAKVNIRDRQRLYNDHSKMLDRQMEQQCNYVYNRLENAIDQEVKTKQKQITHKHEETRQRQQKLQEQHKISAKILDNKMLEAQQKQQEEKEKARKRQQEIRDRLAKLEEAQREFLKVKAHVTETISKCNNQAGLPETVRKYPDVMLSLSHQVESIVNDVRQSDFSSWNVEKLTGYLSKAQNILEFVKQQVEQAEKKAQEVLQQQQAKAKAETDAQAKAQQAQQQAQQAQAAQSASVHSTISADSASRGQGSVILVNSVFQQSLGFYLKVCQKQVEVEKYYQALVKDTQFKKVKFDLQKAVNMPINTISPESGRHLREKLDTINALLNGKTVKISGKTACAKSHVAGVEFCMDLFAKKMVSQGDTQISSQPDAAFAFAAVAVGVWCEYPVVGELMLAHFYVKCPYLLPYYIPKKDGQTPEEYYKSLGYTYENNEVEKQDKFLKRMSGLMRLYAAIMISSPPRPNTPHPYGLDRAWGWLSQIIHLDPRPDTTATMLHEFLEVTAHSLLKVYKNQFIKLIEVIIREYLPKIHGVTLQGSGGPVQRLEIFLDKIRRGNVSAPKGMLSQTFWLT